MSDYNKNPKNQWKKGESGNPNGRPPAKDTLADILRLAGDEPHTIKIDDKEISGTKNELLAVVLYDEALKGNVKAIEHILDRRLGKPLQRTREEGDNASRLFIVHESDIPEDEMK